MADVRCQTCRVLLGEALDLSVRARKMDAIDRRNSTLSISADPQEWIDSGNFDRHVERHNSQYPDTPIATRSGTVMLWMQEQYDSDLADWARRARDHLTAEFCEEA